MLEVEGVTDVHHLHLWNLASDVPDLSAHIVLDGEPTLREAQDTTDQVRAVLEQRFAITNVTLESECGAAAGVASGADRVQFPTVPGRRPAHERKVSATPSESSRIVTLAGARTPIGKFGGPLASFAAVDLGRFAIHRGVVAGRTVRGACRLRVHGSGPAGRRRVSPKPGADPPDAMAVY